MTWHLGSKQRLNPHDQHRFTGDTLFDRAARALCSTRTVPRKELYEAWAVVKHTRRRLKGGPVLDLAGGHGLVGLLTAIADQRTPSVAVVDLVIPDSAATVQQVLTEAFPHLEGRVEYVQGDLRDAEMTAAHRVFGVHACGGLTDLILEHAIAVGARVAVLPCCHSHGKNAAAPVANWMPTDLAIDVARAQRLEAAGYQIWAGTIDPDITPMNRLLVGWPTDSVE